MSTDIRICPATVDGADLAKGTRYTREGGSNDITRQRSVGNRLFCWLVKIRYGTCLSDLYYGFNAFWRRHVPVFGLDATLHPSGDGDGLL